MGIDTIPVATSVVEAGVAEGKGLGGSFRDKAGKCYQNSMDLHKAAEAVRASEESKPAAETTVIGGAQNTEGMLPMGVSIDNTRNRPWSQAPNPEKAGPVPATTEAQAPTEAIVPLKPVADTLPQTQPIEIPGQNSVGVSPPATAVLS